MHATSKIFVAGHRGLVGSATIRALHHRGFDNVVTRPREELDLLDQRAVHAFFAAEKPDVAVIAAARVGGIIANSSALGEFLYENLLIAANTIHAAAEAGVGKLLFLGSSCVYPREAAQPMREDALLTGPLEKTNEGYAIAKIAGLKMTEYYNREGRLRFISAMPTNLYGPGDNFHPTGSHVIPGMMRRFHEAKLSGASQVTVWGTGRPRREFLHVDDLAEALVLLLERYEEPELVNVGTGSDITIAELALLMKKSVGFEGEIAFDASKPDGTPRKLLDVGKITSLGWKPRIPLEQGLHDTYAWALETAAF